MFQGHLLVSNIIEHVCTKSKWHTHTHTHQAFIPVCVDWLIISSEIFTSVYSLLFKLVFILLLVLVRQLGLPFYAYEHVLVMFSLYIFKNNCSRYFKPL